MEIKEFITRAYGKSCCDQSIGLAMIISYLWMSVLSEESYLLLVVGIFYILLPMTPLFNLIENAKKL